ncbi:MAG: internalin [Clostridia bacterium]|nr:internalin [Clostridia bacterium]
MNITLDNFDDFISGSYDYNKENKTHTGFLIRNSNADITGGKTTIDDIDVLKDYPNLDTLTIMGLSQDTFEYFIHKYGYQLEAIRFFKNKFVEDLSLLGTLPNLEFVYFFHNQRVTQLWDMRKNYSLKGLSISDFSRLNSIKNIETAPNIEYFEIGDAIWSTSIIDTFNCLSNTNIKHLSFSGKKIIDEDLSFITEMKALKVFDFATNLYPTEKVAWIMANRPDISGFSLCPTREYMGYNNETNKCDIPSLFIVGKRKPSLTIGKDDNRIRKYIQSFDSLVEKYRGMSYIEAFSDK